MKHRKLTEKTLVIASHNSGKIKEIQELLAPYDIKVRSASEFSLVEPDETGKTFIDNAELKARFVAKQCNLPALADDSGLVVPSLGGDPGIYSARWAGPKKDFNLAMNKIETSLKKNHSSTSGHDAHFVSALSICWPDDYCESFEGKVFGKLTFPARGKNGFGYDPIFIPTGYDITFGEMDPKKKNEISHRAVAFQQFVSACLK